jgi:hypothetical protein
MTLFRLALTVACLAACAGPRPSGEAKPAVPLFDGTSLSGWSIVIDGQPPDADPERIFQARDGVLHVYAENAPGTKLPFGYVVTRALFENYRLRLVYRWGEKRFAPRADAKRDSGLLYHVHGRDLVWPDSVELQIQEGDTGDTFTIDTRVSTTVAPGSVRDGEPIEATFMAAEAGGVAHTQGQDGITRITKSGTFEKEGWNQVELVVRGDRAWHFVNGHLVNQLHDLRTLDAQNQWTPLARGRIALQAEGAEIMYRDITIEAL